MKKVREDLIVQRMPMPVKGREIAVAYSSPFGGASISLTVYDALALSTALYEEAMEVIRASAEELKRMTPEKAETLRRLLKEVSDNKSFMGETRVIPMRRKPK